MTENNDLKKSLTLLFGYLIALVFSFMVLLGIFLIVNSILVGVSLYFIDLVKDTNLFSFGNILFGAFLLTIVEYFFSRKNKQ